jgi:hypothetical protein
MKFVACILMVFHAGGMQQTYKPSSLFKAVKNHDHKTVEAILSSFQTEQERKKLPFLLECQTFPQRRTPLLQATVDNDLISAQMLVEYGANIFANDLTGDNCFSHTIYHKKIKMLNIFMKTPSARQRDRLELALLTAITLPQIYCHPVENSYSNIKHLFIQHLFISNKIYISKYRWLRSLAAASSRAALERPERTSYVRLASTYKQIARFLVRYYNTRRNELVVVHEPATHWNRLPLELRHLTIDFFVHGSQEVQRNELALIEQMPES